MVVLIRTPTHFNHTVAYFFYKIVSVVNLCKELKKKYPDNNFVPVHWMAAEDHDFAEINHINIAGGRLLWEREAGGPVGRLDTASMETVLERLKELTGKSTHGRELVQLFRKAYLEHGNLADARKRIGRCIVRRTIRFCSTVVEPNSSRNYGIHDIRNTKPNWN